MTVKAYAYCVDGGDGSSGIAWFKRELDGGEDDYIEYISDGDGLSPRCVLTFDSYEQAEAAGIRFSEPEEWENNVY
jgi:hypothetical protein